MREWEMEQDCFDWRLRHHATYNCRWTHDVIGVHRKTHTLSSQLLDKQHNFIFGLAGACADKIQLRFQKRSHAAAEPKNTLIAWAHADGAQVVSRPVYFNVLFVLIQKRTNAKGIPSGKNQEPNMLPIPQGWATPAFGSGQRSGTELSFVI